MASCGRWGLRARLQEAFGGVAGAVVLVAGIEMANSGAVRRVLRAARAPTALGQRLWARPRLMCAAAGHGGLEVTTEQVAAFAEDGVVCLRGLVGAQWVERLRAAAAANMDHPGPLCDEHAAASGTAGRFHDDQFLWRRHDACRAFLLEGPTAPAAAALMASAGGVDVLYDHLLVKSPGTTAPTPWHNDYSYWHIRGWQICSAWVALDEVSREAMVRYVRGSHKWRLMHAITNFSGAEADDGRYREAGLKDELPADLLDGSGDYDVVSFDMQPGDVVVHHGFTVHGAGGNASLARQRRGYAIRYLGDDIRFDGRPGTMHWTWAGAGLDCGLRDGDAMTCELHPRVFDPRGRGTGTAGSR